MTITVWPVDAVSGAPSYTGRMLRQTNAVAFAGATSARPLGARSGVRPGTPSTTVTTTSTTFTIQPHAGLLDLETALQASAYAYSIDTAVTGSVTAANATNPRVDIIYVQLNDPAESDGSSTPGLSSTYYLAGTAAASPVAPATPARAMVLAQLNVPTSGGGSPTVTWVAPYLVAAGGSRPVSAVASAGTGGFDGESAWDQTTHQAYRWSAGSAAWQLAADPAVFTAWIAYTPTLTASTTSPTLGPSTLTGRYKQIGKTVFYEIRLAIVTGYGVGTGFYILSLPVAANATSYPVEQAIGTGSVLQSAARRQIIATVWTATSFILSRCSTEAIIDSTGAGAAWANGNILSVSGTYEAA